MNLAVGDLLKDTRGRLTEGQTGGWGNTDGTQASPVRTLFAAAAFAWALAFGVLGFFGNLKDAPLAKREYRAAQEAIVADNPPQGQTDKAVLAYVTGYNTVSSQTSSHPCIAASGADICGRRELLHVLASFGLEPSSKSRAGPIRAKIAPLSGTAKIRYKLRQGRELPARRRWMDNRKNPHRLFPADAHSIWNGRFDLDIDLSTSSER